MRRAASLAAWLALAACEPEFNDIYCLDGPTLPAECAGRFRNGRGGFAGAAGARAAAGSGGMEPTSGAGGAEDPAGAAGSGGSGPSGGAGAAAGGAGEGGGDAGGAGSGTAGSGGAGATASGASGAAGHGAAAGGVAGGSFAGGAAGASGAGGQACNLGTAACAAPVEVGLGRGHACVRRGDGAVLCWGDGSSGQLGLGGAGGGASVPALVPGIAATRLSCGGDTTCVVRSAGAVACWGDDSTGQLGRGVAVTGDARGTPEGVLGLATARSVTVGRTTACAIESNGSVRCWGANDAGQLGSGPTLSRTPVLSTFQGVAAPSTDTLGIGAARFCGRTSLFAVRCVGGDRFGPGLADTNAGDVGIEAGTIPGGVAVGEYFGCVVTSTNLVKCWGRGDEGQLGAGGAASTSRVDAETVPGVEGATSVAVGAAHACAIQPNETLKCWGDCSRGACGNGQAVGSTPTVASPAAVPNLDNVKKVFAGHHATCALLDGGALKCWGEVAGAAATSVPTTVVLP